MNSLIEKPAGKEAVRFLLNSLGAIPFIGGAISASASLWGEIEQQKFNEVLTSWATKTDNEINEILFTLNNLLETPTKAKFSLLIGEIMGDNIANQFLLQAGNQIPMVLNDQTVNELVPFIEKKWLSIQSTGSLCNMGAGNKVGNHVEELKRPWGMGSGFVLKIEQEFFNN